MLCCKMIPPPPPKSHPPFSAASLVPLWSRWCTFWSPAGRRRRRSRRKLDPCPPSSCGFQEKERKRKRKRKKESGDPFGLELRMRSWERDARTRLFELMPLPSHPTDDDDDDDDMWSQENLGKPNFVATPRRQFPENKKKVGAWLMVPEALIISGIAHSIWHTVIQFLKMPGLLNFYPITVLKNHFLFSSLVTIKQCCVKCFLCDHRVVISQQTKTLIWDCYYIGLFFLYSRLSPIS